MAVAVPHDSSYADRQEMHDPTTPRRNALASLPVALGAVPGFELQQPAAPGALNVLGVHAVALAIC